jgi:hypothetical protein
MLLIRFGVGDNAEGFIVNESPSKAEGLLTRMTMSVMADDLPFMVLEKNQLPADLASFDLLREQVVDNLAVANDMGAKHTADSVSQEGRLNGYERLFAVPPGAATLEAEPSEVLQAASAVHLFAEPDEVARWIDKQFIAELRGSVGAEDGQGQKIIGVELLEAAGFHDHAASLLVVREVPGATMASTIIEFRMGCLLGVVSVDAKLDKKFAELATELGSSLERQIVQIVLGAS